MKWLKELNMCAKFTRAINVTIYDPKKKNFIFFELKRAKFKKIFCQHLYYQKLYIFQRKKIVVRERSLRGKVLFLGTKNGLKRVYVFHPEK